MSIYLVDVHHVTHTCPSSVDPHPYDTTRTVRYVTDGGACRTPVTIRCGDKTVSVACGRHEPAHRQCAACRVIVTERTITAEHLTEALA